MEREAIGKLPSQVQQQLIDDSLKNVLKVLNPEVATKVASKWEEDQRLFRAAVRKETEGKEAHEWGKASCKHCYGRGFIATRLDNKRKVVCRCATKNYQKWLQAFREEFNTLRDEENGNDKQAQAPTTDRPENTQEALTSSEAQS